MSSVSKTILIGNLGQDPEQKFLPSGDAVTNFSLATSEKWKDKQTGQPQEATEWHRCVAFGRAAEVIAEFARKGSKMYVEGSNRTRKWQGQDGQDRYTTEIKVREFQLLDAKPQDGGNQRQPPAPKQQAAPQNAPQGTGGYGSFDDFDDIPY